MNIDDLLGSGKKGGRGRGKSSSGYKKPAGRPKIKPEEGCTVVDGWNGDKHVFVMFGKPQETCVKCGMQHPRVTEWRLNLMENPSSNKGHPFVISGFWSLAEYKMYMKR